MPRPVKTLFQSLKTEYITTYMQRNMNVQPCTQQHECIFEGICNHDSTHQRMCIYGESIKR